MDKSQLHALLALLAFTIATPADARETRAFRPSALQIYYGDDAAIQTNLMKRMGAGHVVVVETRAWKKDDLDRLTKKANDVGAKILSYLSIGELHDNDEKRYREFLEVFLKENSQQSLRFKSLEAITLQRNDQFQSRQVDVLSKAWRAFVLSEAKRLRGMGVHGLFLDTVDTVDLYIVRKTWPIPRRVESVNAMQTLIREIKSRDRSAFVMQNRGLNLIDRKVFVGNEKGVEISGMALAQANPNNPDAVLWENAFAASDQWSRQKETQLREIQRNGRTSVFALGYAKTLRSFQPFFKKCSAAGFIPAWATSSSTLHLELTDGEP